MEDRSRIGPLVVLALDLLGPTGLDDNQFSLAFLHKGEEGCIRTEVQRNTWAVLLKDTPSTACFSMLSDRCLLCNIPDHSSATCRESSGLDQACTTLQTRISVQTAGWQSLILKPTGKRLEKVDIGSDFPVVLRVDGRLRIPSMHRVEGTEVCKPVAPGGKKPFVYIQASEPSHGGMTVPRSEARADIGLGSSRRASYDGIASFPEMEVSEGPSTDAGLSPTAAGFHGSKIQKGRAANKLAAKVEFGLTNTSAPPVQDKSTREVLDRPKGGKIKAVVKWLFVKIKRTIEG